jgi:hypothetical protein
MRGDVNADGQVQAISDAIYLLQYGFVSGPVPPCLEAADANGNGVLEALADTIYLLSFGFIGGPPPPNPFPACGADPSPGTSIGCGQPTC